MDNKYKSISDEEFLLILKNELERIGTSSYRSYNNHRNEGLPDSKYFQGRYNRTWGELMELIGIEQSIKRLSKQEFDQWFINLVADLGTVPSRYYLQNNYSFYHFHMRKYYDNHTNLCKIVNYEVEKKNVVTHSDEELLQLYYGLYLKIEKAPTKVDLKQNDFPYSYDTLRLRFGSFERIRTILNIPQDKRYMNLEKISKEDVQTELIRLYKENGEMSISKLNELCKYSTSTILRKYNTTKITDVWKEIKKEI